MKRVIAGVLMSVLVSSEAGAETECTGTGDMRGFRYQGEALNVTSSIRFASPDGAQSGQASLTGTRNGKQQTFTGNVAPGALAAPGGGGRGRGGGGGGGGPTLREVIEDTAPDTSTFDIQVTATTPFAMEGMYFWLNVPGAMFEGGTMVTAATEGMNNAVRGRLRVSADSGSNRLAELTTQRLQLTSPDQHVVEIQFAEPTTFVIQETRNQGRGGRGGQNPGNGATAPSGPPASYNVVIPIGRGTLNPGAPLHVRFTLKASWKLDETPVALKLDTSRIGPAFAGIGGNFRIQSNNDAAPIAYNLENLRLAWARVEMPLASWQTTETGSPEAAPLANNVRQAMEMGRTLAQKKIPMIISDWSAPDWAVGPNSGGGRGGAGGGNASNARSIAAEKWPAMYKGIVSYLQYMKRNYGAEPVLFSFNESDQGINVRVSPEEHRVLIRELGAQFVAADLVTRMLLGDTGNPSSRPANYIDPALGDPEAMKYVGAISYHSWTGGSDQVLASWGRAAQVSKVPLLVAEGGTDPASYRYRSLFLEPWYALDEINLYIRCLQFSQPASILHWQLTDDYSILSGGRNGQPLVPTQRFYNLQQMNLTPPEAPALGIACDRPRLAAAAYGDATHGYAVHLTNTGATREVTVTGLPTGVTQLYPYVTDATRRMKALGPIEVMAGRARFTVDDQSYLTLTSRKP